MSGHSRLRYVHRLDGDKRFGLVEEKNRQEKPTERQSVTVTDNTEKKKKSSDNISLYIYIIN